MMSNSLTPNSDLPDPDLPDSGLSDLEGRSDDSDLPADSAGTPWAGRKLSEHPYAGDTGEIDPELATLLEKYERGECELIDVIECLQRVRILAPIVAELEAGEEGEHGLHVDKAASAAIVAVGLPDGRTALPVFSSMQQMQEWNPSARPIPTELARAALSVVAEDWQTIILDPAGCALVIPRPAVWAIAEEKHWQPAVTGGVVDVQLAERINTELAHPSIVRVDAVPGRNAEVCLELALVPGLRRSELDTLLAATQEKLATSEVISRRVDSLELKLKQA